MSNDVGQGIDPQLQAYFQQLAGDVARNGGLSGSGTYFKLGVYELTLKRAHKKDGHRGKNSIIFEFRVDSATPSSKDEEPNAPGSTVSQVLKPDEQSDYGLVSRKNLLRIACSFANISEAAFATPEGQASAAKMLATLLHPSNPCRGMAIRAEAFGGENKKGEDRTYVEFSHDPRALDPAERAKRAQSLDAGQ